MVKKKKSSKRRKSNSRSKVRSSSRTTKNKNRVTKEKEPSYMVQIGNPKVLRKDILESLRDVILIMQAYEHFKRIQEEKETIISQMKDDLKELNSLMGKLSLLVPKGKLKSILEQIPKLPVDLTPETSNRPMEKLTRPSSVEPQEVVQHEKNNGLEELEGQLRDIENQLKNIN